MSIASHFLRTVSCRRVSKHLNQINCSQHVRGFADIVKADTSKQLVSKVQGTENEQKLRVRRARATDVPRVLRFVRESARAWPAPAAPPSPLVLEDYVARALAQGHSMLAEQHEPRRGWSRVRGLALGAACCPWDAALLERWARCVRGARSRRLVRCAAHCLRAPALHDKYRVHNILQVILIVPPDAPKSAEIVQVLAKNSIGRGREAGFPMVRFDVTSDTIAKALEDINLKKEWQLSYDVLPESLTEGDPESLRQAKRTKCKDATGRFIAVYTAFTNSKQ